MDRPIEIIPIAKKKLRRRGIETSWVVETLRSPEQIVEGHGGRGGKRYLLRIVFEDRIGYLLVVTAYLTSQIARSWKEKNDEGRV